MWVEELTLENIKCFGRTVFRFGKKDRPYPWVTLLGENGAGKSTVLQALGLLLAGPESAQVLLSRPAAWLRDENERGMITVRVHQGAHDPGQFAGEQRTFNAFGYSFYVTGSQRILLNKKYYNEPAIVEGRSPHLPWLRQNAYTSDGKGWFAAGYGPFRRLTREDQIIVPSLDRPARFTNFSTQFDENEPLSTFERWMVYLDYRISKRDNAVHEAAQVRSAVEAINSLLPEGTRYSRVSDEGRVLFAHEGAEVPTVSLSDGYRSVLALAGDLIWRLVAAFPESRNPLGEEGVVIIDELDIHLHPKWQRQIAAELRRSFPNIQFIVATHSPFIAAGAGDDALTLRLQTEGGGRTVVESVPDVAFKSVDDALRSSAFDLVSLYSPQAQAKIDQYDALRRKKRRTPAEEELLGQLSLFMANARPFGGPPEEGSLEARIEQFLEKTLP